MPHHWRRGDLGKSELSRGPISRTWNIATIRYNCDELQYIFMHLNILC